MGLARARTARLLALAALAAALPPAAGCASGGGLGGSAAGKAWAEPRSLPDVLARLVWPLRFDERRNVRSPYGYRSWGGGYGRYHYGLDLQARRGDPVYSAGEGRVAAIGRRGAYGNSIQLDHGQGVSSFYAHLDRVLTTPGSRVRRGQVIGLVGSTGNATGPHLHFELRWKDRWVDPLVVLPELE